MKKIILSLITLTIILNLGCNNDDNTSESNFDLDLMFSDVAQNIILPTIANFVTEANALQIAATNYTTNTTEANLESLREEWKRTAIIYEKTYTYNFGSAKDQFVHNSIYNWPTVPRSVEYFISENNTIDDALMLTISPQVKSLAALEYLLFADDLATTNTAFLASEKRRNYLRLSSSYVTSRANLLFSIWDSSGENYTSTFLENSGSGISSSLNLYYNGLYNTIDVTKTTKVGKPAGLEKSDVVNPELTQAFYSNTSLAIIEANMKTVELAYFGSANTLGLDDYVQSISKSTTLNTTIQAKFTEIYAAIKAIPVPLAEAVTSNHTEVQTLHTKLNELQVLFAVDVQSILSIIITTTDTDGD
ncbi:imelysin family protein [Cellulophaga sp. E16_2]|uniref:imelysin family protein n=1 Tax=Cellulophaga sp. E16_2 TaxID=2789297 RepID=UPI001A93312E|nr:imelysin family protein [Cellulophaga sp. E16_2]MBO0590047.1 imelysin family protein [Cellulophaga sp. E16_2]